MRTGKRTPRRLAALLAWGAGFAACAQFAPHEMLKPAAYTNGAGKVIAYRLSAPQFPEPGKKYAMILFLHGSGECGTDNLRQTRVGLPALLKELVKRPEQVIVAAPQCRVSNAWVKRVSFSADYSAPPEPTLALKWAMEICDDLIRNRQADPDRFYITGLSLGGFGTWDAARRWPGRFAAAAPICGGGDVRKPAGMKRLPIWVAHGDADKNVPPECSRRMVQALRQAGNGRVVYKRYGGAGHNVWDRTYSDPEFLTWLLSQNRAKKPWWRFW